MGGALASHVVDLAALGYLANASDRARLVLLIMSTVARDKAQPNVEAGIYYGGWEYLAKCLGFKAYTSGARRAVARAMRELVDLGLVEPLGFARPGHRQGYRITLPERLPNVPL